MKLLSRITLSVLLVMVPLCTWASDDRYVKGLIQCEAMFGGGNGFNLGAGINLGKETQILQFQTSINYKIISNTGRNSEEDKYSTVDKMGIKYTSISVPFEMHVQTVGIASLFAGAGVVYNYNIGGKLVDKENGISTPLTDGINRHNFAGRISIGVNFIRLSMKLYTDIKITDPLKKYSISDRLFEYSGPIERALGRATLGMAIYYRF